MLPCTACSFVMKMAASPRRYLESVWYGGDSAPLFLLPFAWLFGVLSSARRALFRLGIFHRPQLPVPVIVVGNINVGGTGKTPIVAWLAGQLRDAGYRPGIVSRGYGAAKAGGAVMVDSADAAAFGDEPVLLAKLTGCPVCICPDRVKAVERLAREGVDIVISDDGLQHYRLRRSSEIVVIDGERGFGNGRLLPAGPLREPVSRLTAVDAVLINGLSNDIAGLSFKLEPGEAVALANGARRSVDAFSGKRVWAVAGIGNPGRFVRELERAGMQVDVADVPDHASVSLQRLVAARNQPILMTEKDAVKYPGCTLQDAWYIPVQAKFSPTDAAQLLAALLPVEG
jgi:tetraacyldisaccharide 4'-kinase